MNSERVTSNAGTRTYESPLRAEQAQATRERILDALVKAMADGLATLSVAAVAREAGVSAQTVYRHFGSKAGLLEALGPYIGEKAGLWPASDVKTIHDRASIRDVFAHLESMDETLRAAVASQIGHESRLAAMPRRRGAHEGMVRRSAPGVAEEDIQRLTDLAVTLMSSGTYHVLRDYLGLSPDQAADLVAWALQTLVHGTHHQHKQKDEE